MSTTTQALEDLEQELEHPAPIDQSTVEQASAEAQDDSPSEESSEKISSEKKEEDLKYQFKSLTGKIHPKTLSKLTGDPFNFQTMSDIQYEILSRMPEVAGLKNLNERKSDSRAPKKGHPR